MIMEKLINGYDKYYITDDGKVISYKYHNPRVMKTWFQKTGYENIKLCQDGIMHHHLIHRLVAEAFIPNPLNLPEVNHIDGNPKNNRVENLEWITTKENINKSYETSGVGPLRNHLNCSLYKKSTNEKIKDFESVNAAATYASEHFDCSKSSLIKYKESKDYKIETCND